MDGYPVSIENKMEKVSYYKKKDFQNISQFGWREKIKIVKKNILFFSSKCILKPSKLFLRIEEEEKV